MYWGLGLWIFTFTRCGVYPVRPVRPTGNGKWAEWAARGGGGHSFLGELRESHDFASNVVNVSHTIPIRKWWLSSSYVNWWRRRQKKRWRCRWRRQRKVAQTQVNVLKTRKGSQKSLREKARLGRKRRQQRKNNKHKIEGGSPMFTWNLHEFISLNLDRF